MALCAIAKNEGLYLEEWAAYHLALGFDRIHIYDNGSTDFDISIFGRRAWQSRVIVYSWPGVPGEAPQLPAYRDFLVRHGCDFGWVMFLDIDEFLNLKQDADVKAFLTRFPRDDAVAVNSRFFGSAGGASEGRLVIERFTRCAEPQFDANALVKTIFKPRAVREPAIHCPDLRPRRRMVNPAGRRIAAGAALQRDVDYEVAQINHYFTKSREEFVLKRARGRADIADQDPQKFRSEQEFDAYDRNEMEDISILRRVAAVRALLDDHSQDASGPGF